MVWDDCWQDTLADTASDAKDATMVPMTLPANEIHIWYASLDQQAEGCRLLADAPSSDERARASRFHFQRDRRRFLVSRTLLRVILGLYLDLEPSQVQFRYGQYGKPFLAESLGDFGLCFNVAHSHELAVLSFARGLSIGVDLEYVRELPDAEQIAVSFFSEGENAAWRALPADEKTEGFYNCWTRKEAFIKAVGDGLSHPLKEFRVSLAPGEPARFLSIAGDVLKASRWSLWALTPSPGYVAALAAPIPEAEKKAFRLRILDAPAL